MRFSPVNQAKIGALLWISSVQYFIVQIVVIAAWPVPHSLANNFISDLGNTECGTYAGLAVCSPLHPLMNLSFILFGISMAVGAVLLWKTTADTGVSKLALVLMALAGIGTVMVGVFPENTVSVAHTTGAALSLGIGNLSVLMMGISMPWLGRAMRGYTIASGVFSLCMFGLFIFGLYGVLGRGGIERLISYPFTIWMIAFGVYVLLCIRHQKHRFV